MKQKLIIFSLIITILLTGCKSNNNTAEPETTTTVFAPQSTVRENEPPVITKPAASADKPVVTKPAETTSGEKKTPTASESHDKSSPIHINDKGASITGDTGSYIKGVRIPDNIYAPDGEKIGKADITDIKESADIGEWRAECGGFAYLALPSEYPEYNRFDIDDKIMDFTVTEAKTYFSNLNLTEEQTDKTRFYEGGAVTLAGEVTMEGFIRVYEESEPSPYKNKVVFTPKSDCMILPIFDIPDTVRPQPFEAAESVGLGGDNGYCDIVLGNAKDFDLSEISGGEYAEASVILDGIRMRVDVNTGTYISAEGAEITVL